MIMQDHSLSNNRKLSAFLSTAEAHSIAHFVDSNASDGCRAGMHLDVNWAGASPILGIQEGTASTTGFEPLQEIIACKVERLKWKAASPPCSAARCEVIAITALSGVIWSEFETRNWL
jgi:hypothetical protein